MQKFQARNLYFSFVVDIRSYTFTLSPIFDRKFCTTRLIHETFLASTEFIALNVEHGLQLV